MRKQKILVIEDNVTTSNTLVLFLSAEGCEATCAYNGQEGLAAFRSGDFDLVLLDLMLPDLDGVSLCRSIREDGDTPVIMLTAKTTEDDIVEGLEAGADDYVCKPFGSKELLARVRRCLRSRLESAALNIDREIRVGDLSLNAERRLVKVSDDTVKLTRSEYEVLALLMNHPGRVFTRDQIIELALGPNFDGFDRTVDTHIWSLRKKLGEPRGAPRYIHSELGIGYRLHDAQET